mgnify:CR=1 FL=1
MLNSTTNIILKESLMEFSAIRSTACMHTRTMDAQWSLFSSKSKTYGLGQTISTHKFWDIWGIFGQFISNHFGTVSSFFMFSINQSILFLQKTKPSNDYLGFGIWAAKNYEFSHRVFVDRAWNHLSSRSFDFLFTLLFLYFRIVAPVFINVEHFTRPSLLLTWVWNPWFFVKKRRSPKPQVSAYFHFKSTISALNSQIVTLIAKKLSVLRQKQTKSTAAEHFYYIAIMANKRQKCQILK